MKKPGLILFVLLSLLSIEKAKTSSIMGSDLSWSCIGQDSFLVKLVVYRDCNGDALIQIPLQITCASTWNYISTIHFNPGIAVDITPISLTSCTRCQSSSCSFPYGIHRFTMQAIVNLSNAGACCNIKLSWQQCCRNSSITTGAAEKNFYTEAILNRCLHPCDNSSTFSEAPVTILCVGREYQFLQGGDDIDLTINGFHRDSIRYEIIPPLQSAIDSISYTGQYSSTNPIYFDGFPDNKLSYPKGFHLIKETGDIQFKPTKAEVSVMALKVSEYRNGVLIGEQRREMEFITITCTENHPPTFKTPNNVRSKSVCEGTPVSFSFSTNDSDIYDTVTISWNNALPGAIWTSTNGQSKHPTGILTYTAMDTFKYNHSDIFTFTVTARDNAYPVRGTFTQAYQIIVKPFAKAKLKVSDSCNGLFYFRAERILGYGPSFLWQGNNFEFKPNVGSLVTHRFTQYGEYPYTMTMTANGCSVSLFDTIVYFPIKAQLPKDTALCKNAQLHLRLNMNPMPRNYFVLWSSGNRIYKNDTIAEFNVTVTSDTIIVANIYTSKWCWVAADTINIKLLNCTSIGDQGANGFIKVSPNPATEDIVISTEIPGMIFKTISIYNNLGMLVKQFDNFGTNSLSVKREFANSGMYFVRIVMMNGEIGNTKLIWK